MTDAPNLAFAETAFAAAIPPVEFRPGARRAPRRNRRGPVGVVAAIATVAIATTVVFNTGSNTGAAWSATPSDLSSADANHMDQQCRAASAPDDANVNGNGISGAVGGATDITGSGGSSDGSALFGSGPGAAPPVATRTIGDLPLILIDARGSMAIALYGDAQHHIVCTLDPQGNAMLTPDSGAWPAGDPIATAASLGFANDAGGGSVEGSMKLLGAVASDVTAITVAIPGVGSVTATVANGDYALFVPQDLLSASTGSSWTAYVTKSDGSVQTVQMQGVAMSTGPDGSITVRGGNTP